MSVAVVPDTSFQLEETPLTAMVGGYFLRLLTVTISVARAINTNEYVNISPYVTIAAPPLQEVDNLATLLDYMVSVSYV